MNAKELEIFKANVKGQFLAIKQAIKVEKSLEEMDPRSMRDRGMIDRFFMRASVVIGLKGVNMAQKKRGAAREIISLPEVIGYICSKSSSNERALEVDELVDRVTTAILRPEVPLNDADKRDDELIGACCVEISEVGLDNYCSTFQNTRSY